MKRIIGIENDININIKTSTMLGKQYNFDMIINNWEGLGAALQHGCDLIIVNLCTPVMDGVEMIRLLRTEEAMNNVPVLIYSIPQNQRYEQKALEFHNIHYLGYPFEDKLLLEKIETLTPQID